MITIKINLELDPEEINRALIERNILVNQSNIKRFIGSFRKLTLPMMKETYERFPRDREQLLMCGFSLKKGGDSQ